MQYSWMPLHADSMSHILLYDNTSGETNMICESISEQNAV